MSLFFWLGIDNALNLMRYLLSQTEPANKHLLDPDPPSGIEIKGIAALPLVARNDREGL
jgi:hypothetical protein